ncbi:luciferase [Reticulibacter mediterranei]|uniref:Luciferase n=1 Tax=Reticulibacter mediterranei TaxID=2778369 RepID=A0A8J3INY1_9CHLR|nr:LLM class flavin-dependent oxidoreductase [Reticulibacter mediterranei]GHO94422.1 luciferase [Reticulibacter mediterranei]
MKIGTGLPIAIPGTQANLLLEWAKRAEQGPFSSLGVLDRVVYDNYEPLITLAVVAGVTTRLRLVTTVLLAPTRNTGILAKQAASLDALSGGRLTLGLGIGGRKDDFLAAPADFHTRGKRFNEQLEFFERAWSGQPINDQIGPIGPTPARPGGPEILIGGYSGAAIQRLSRWGNGFIAGGRAPDQVKQFFQMARDAWQKAGRPGQPRLAAIAYYGLGPQATEGIEKYITHYYSFLGPAAQQMAKNVPSSPEAVRTLIQAFSDLGVDEVLIGPCIPELDQIDRLADAIK